MSLSKQMIVFVISILLVILVGTFFLNFTQTKSYLEEQLESNAQDTATSLGLSLSSVADAEETSSMETMINAVFDRGYYEHIELMNTKGKVIYSRKSIGGLDNLPEWFIGFASIESPGAGALIQSGWLPIGRLEVKSNPNLAYIKLWENTIAVSVWFLIATIFTIIFAYIAIKLMLSPLKKMEEQADAIVRKEYLIQDPLPRTTEFKQVVLAMNKMVHKMKTIFHKDAKMVEKLQKMAYQDGVTGLSNRSHFEMNIEPLLDEKEDAVAGIICLIRVQGLKEVNEKYGYLVGDGYMEKIANKINQETEKKSSFNARINGTEIVVVAPAARSEFLVLAMENILSYLPEIEKELDIAGDEINTSVAMVDYLPGNTRANLLEKLDSAVKHASSLDGKNLFYNSSNIENTSDDDWDSIINLAIEEQRLSLFQQTAYTNKQKPHSKELYLRLQKADGKTIPAADFIPAVQRLKREAEIDNLVLKMVVNYLSSLRKNSIEKVSINLNCLVNSELISIVEDNLAIFNPLLLSFEVAEKLIIKEEESIKPVIKRLKDFNIRFGIDNFGSNFANMSYLQHLLPDYIKLDASFSHSIEKDEQTRSYVSSLVDMCHSLDIEVIAIAIENKPQQQAFADLGISIFQGYLYSAPEPLKNVKKQGK